MEAFQALPIAAVVNGEYLALHGGISSRLQTLDQINDIDRFKEPENADLLFNDLLWADPMRGVEKAQSGSEVKNKNRGISVEFGWDILRNLLERNKLKTLVRSHEQRDDGFKMHMWAGPNADPPCITIFSAPNYCEHENPGSILVTASSTEKAKILTYLESNHNFFLPDHRDDDDIVYPMVPNDAFSSFAPYMCDWLTEIFQTILDIMNDEENAI